MGLKFNRRNVAKVMAHRFEVNIGDAEKMVGGTFEAVAEILAAGSGIAVSIPGFGTFKRITRKARKARNPRTGETVTVAERTVVTFRPTKPAKGKIKV